MMRGGQLPRIYRENQMSELVQVKIKGIVVTSRYGALSTGDLLRTNAEFAKHLVEECGAAEYVKGSAHGADGVTKKQTQKQKAKEERAAAVQKLEGEISALEAEVAALPQEEPQGFAASLLSKLKIGANGTARESIQAALDAKRAEMVKLLA